MSFFKITYIGYIILVILGVSPSYAACDRCSSVNKDGDFLIEDQPAPSSSSKKTTSQKTFTPYRAPSYYVLGLSAGAVYSNPGQTQTFYLRPNIEKTYAAENESVVLGSGEIFLGIQRELNANLLGQFGVAGAAASNAKLTGQIWDDANAEFNNFSYAYHVNHAHVALKSKLIAYSWKTVQPYVSASIGIGWNNASGFTITPKIFEAIPSEPFGNATTTTFTYNLGLGMQKALSPCWQIGVGYEFADWGKSSLSAAPQQTLNSGLQLNHLYTHQLQFTLIFMGKLK